MSKHDISKPLTMKQAREYIAHVTGTKPNPKKNRLVRKGLIRYGISRQNTVKLLGPNRMKPPKPIQYPYTL